MRYDFALFSASGLAFHWVSPINEDWSSPVNVLKIDTQQICYKEGHNGFQHPTVASDLSVSFAVSTRSDRRWLSFSVLLIPDCKLPSYHSEGTPSPITGGGGGAAKEPIVINNPSGGDPAKFHPVTVGEALDVLEGTNGFGKGRLQDPDGTILARGSPLKQGAKFVPNVAKGGPISM